MQTVIWILQGILATIFLFSGIYKTTFDPVTLVQKGQTGVEGLPKSLIKFIGLAEITGAVGLILPLFVPTLAHFMPIAAICLGTIMVPAAFIHFERIEYRPIFVNMVILIMCAVVASFYMVGPR